jgi:DNA-directed RNA polymerase specialized sigma24 family protein
MLEWKGWVMIAPSECADGPTGEGGDGYVVDMALWQRLYGYVRGQGGFLTSHEDARDLVQEVFYHLSRTGALERARREAKSEAQFFAFLKTTAKNRMIKNWRKAQARKRGGGVRHLSLNGEDGEWLLNTLATPGRGDASVYLKLEERVAEGEARLRAEFRRRGKAELFKKLQPFLCGESAGIGYAALARESGFSEQALRNALFRARRRFRELLR